MKAIHPIQAFIEAIISAAVFVLLLGVSTHLTCAKSAAALEAQIKSGPSIDGASGSNHDPRQYSPVKRHENAKAFHDKCGKRLNTI
ncbi:hypothetical protein P4S72_26755 [Vibrio sp. PP-XX7]